ncbi:hypothetical protein AVEN_187352-1 [Araneus ventricosus]|uniref:Uncharacterized protein n=1 Tax=Araneus ventricosus TaxID=182803 RepID=A0A4Y2Q4Y8_ARAVE|nr:hypothetical protein AVEN_187352-1 [Araneus ventricosus]
MDWHFYHCSRAFVQVNVEPQQWIPLNDNPDVRDQVIRSVLDTYPQRLQNEEVKSIRWVYTWRAEYDQNSLDTICSVFDARNLLRNLQQDSICNICTCTLKSVQLLYWNKDANRTYREYPISNFGGVLL